jgi:hypothetical protein
MLRATWKPTADLHPHQWRPDRSLENAQEGSGAMDRELYRASCGPGSGRDACNEALAFYWFHDMGGHPNAFRVPPGFVWHKAADLLYGLWELPARAQKQRQRAAQEGKLLRGWRPPPRHRLPLERLNRVAEAVTMDGAVPGAVGLPARPGGRHGPLVDPDLTGGVVVVRCPRCGQRNNVGPPPTGG